MADEIRCDIADGIATLTLNRPDKRNAMNTAMLDGLEDSGSTMTATLTNRRLLSRLKAFVRTDSETSWLS